MNASIMLCPVCVAQECGIASLTGEDGLCIESRNCMNFVKMVQKPDLLIEDLATVGAMMGTRRRGSMVYCRKMLRDVRGGVKQWVSGTT